MRSWVTERDEYDEKILSPGTIEVARLQLRETLISRRQALASLRDWICKNPKIENCRLDSSFLLRFLRTKKMSVPLAQENLERFLLLRTMKHIWNFQNLDCDLPDLDELINSGYIYVAPKRDHLGRRIVITKPGKFDPHKYKNTIILRLHGLAYETIMENEEDQVNGVVHFVDGAGVSFPYLTLFTPREAVRIAKNAEKNLPLRHKQIIGFNVHPGMKFALDWALTLVSPKLKNRIKIFTTLKETYSEIDRKLLPKEYGGEMPQAEMITLWKQELKQKREKLLLNDQMKVNLSLFSDKERQGSASAPSAPSQVCNPDGSVYGINGSFRKLEVD